jgi:hypothetical protein
MVIPDFLNPKILYPSVIFYILSLVNIPFYYKIGLFVAAFTLSLNTTTLVYTKNDIIIPTILYALMYRYDVLYYIIVVALLRTIFPQMYY